ncbi:hypothetical protein [Vibrio spartinae]|uniref:Uncharacterized protein n=1 Tax=Vibrio spartinae TaxID=1918945 RepID=A0A1N6M5V6_9VIBR|nr:hypothetical protein [Vibrio spartinae]SIO94822.1 hypothetical protein VSP9026_02552 [Vibrio spartinae]
MTTERDASHVIKKLRQYGCDVLAAMKTPRCRFVIRIAKPTSEMAVRATPIHQCLNGVPSVVYTMQLDGCIIQWNGGEPCNH